MKILFILSRYPWPLEKGDKLRAYHFIRVLSKNHEIHLFSLSDQPLSTDDLSMLQPYCMTITTDRISKIDISKGILWSLFNRKPFQVGYFYKKSINKKIKRLISDITPDILFCQLLRVADYAKVFQGYKILDYQDSFSLNMTRRAEASPLLARIIFRREARLLKAMENRVFEGFNMKLIISEPDRDAISHHNRENIIVIPNGVDFSYFTPSDQINKDYDIVFTGNMSYPPNVEAAVWLTEEILPAIRKKLPETTLLIAGASPSKHVKSLAGNGVTVTGWVPDIRDAYNRSKIFIAPMKTGSGLQNKLLEAMAMKLPCITTSLANASLKATDGIHILIADNTEDIAEKAMLLLKNATKASAIASAGNGMVKSSFQWEKNIGIIENKLKI